MPPRKPFICVVGSINLDLVVRCERLPRPGETVSGGELARVPGGKGANQAVACARMGADTMLMGRVGRDTFADEALAILRADGVRLAVDAVDAPTGVAMILVADDGENQIVVAPGANGTLVEVEAGGDAVICQLEVPDAALVSAARGADGFFVLNAAPARPVPPEVLERVDVLVVNEYEYEALGPLPRVPWAAVTRGAEGARMLHQGAEIARVAPPPVTAVDGTGAGDAFTAAFVVSLLEQRPPEEVLRRACAAGALAASRFGAQTSLPTAAEVDALL